MKTKALHDNIIHSSMSINVIGRHPKFEMCDINSKQKIFDQQIQLKKSNFDLPDLL